jgi:hypothetical protein
MPTKADAHRLAQRRLDEQTSAKLAAMLRSFDDPTSQASFDAYNLAAAKLVGGAQRRAAQLALVYFQSFGRYSSPPIVERAIKDVRVDRESPVTRSPMLRIAKLVGEGLVVAAAVDQAARYAGSLSSNDLQVAQRGGLAEGASVSSRDVIGWTKELSGDACAWCQEVAEGVYGDPDGVPFHENDQCAVTPVFAGE